jgi:hypothetical protein
MLRSALAARQYSLLVDFFKMPAALAHLARSCVGAKLRLLRAALVVRQEQWHT